jgi:hypothetical protein
MRTILAMMILLASVGMYGEDKIQPLNVKPGMWETTTSMNRSGHMPIPDSLLARLTPEQRAKMQERMKAQPNDKASTSTQRSCVTKEQIEKAEGLGEDRPECTRKVVSSSSSRLEIHMVCNGEGMKGEGTVEVLASSPESAKGTVHMTVSANGNSQPMVIESTFTSKWVGATCTKED